MHRLSLGLPSWVVSRPVVQTKIKTSEAVKPILLGQDRVTFGSSAAKSFTVLSTPFVSALDSELEKLNWAPQRQTLAKALIMAGLTLEDTGSETDTINALQAGLNGKSTSNSASQYAREAAGEHIVNLQLARFYNSSNSVRDAALKTSQEAFKTHQTNLSTALRQKWERYHQDSTGSLVHHRTTKLSALDTPVTLDQTFITAVQIATELHATQKRHGTKTPYVSHLFNVAAGVILAGGSQNAVIAALLHDAIEDQPRSGETRKRIASTFAPEVLDIIDDCSITFTGDWLHEKRSYIEHIPEFKNPESPLVMSSDKRHNLESLLDSLTQHGPSATWGAFRRGQNDQIWFYQRVLSELDRHIPTQPLQQENHELLYQIKRRSFAEEAMPYAQSILTQFPAYKALSQIVTGMGTTCQVVSEGANRKTVCPDSRTPIHTEVIDGLYSTYLDRKQALQQPAVKEAHIVTGLLASGKTSRVVNQLAEGRGLLVLEADLVKEYLPEHHMPVDDPRLSALDEPVKAHNGLGATMIHAESSIITDKLLERALGNEDSFVIAHTGRDKAYDISFMRDLKQRGYRVFLHHVEIPPSSAIDRSLKRYREQGRFFTPELIGKLGVISTDNFVALKHQGLKEGFLDGTTWWYNGVFENDPPILVEQLSRPEA